MPYAVVSRTTVVSMGALNQSMFACRLTMIILFAPHNNPAIHIMLPKSYVISFHLVGLGRNFLITIIKINSMRRTPRPSVAEGVANAGIQGQG